MDAVRGMRAASRRQGRCWHFASAVLDEDSWTLRVDGQRVPLEAKPMEVLHELLLRAGQVVSKDELLDAVWPGIAVVEERDVRRVRRTGRVVVATYDAAVGAR